MTARRIYIAGPMRGRPEMNVSAFNRATARFRVNGWDVVNPVEVGERLFGNNASVAPQDYVRADILELCNCNAIALLPEWETSTGARCEAVIAMTLGLAFYDAESPFDPIECPKTIICRGGYDCGPGKVDTLDSLADEARGWARATFRTATPESKAEHLAREALELFEAPEDVEEMADIFILLADASVRHDLPKAIRDKLDRNKKRRWGNPDAQGVVEHVEQS